MSFMSTQHTGSREGILVRATRQPLTRRQLLKGAGIGGAATLLSACIRTSPREEEEPTRSPVASGGGEGGGQARFVLPPLPYAYDALEPHIDAMTMEIHHDKHHSGYVSKLNAALEDYPDLQDQTVVALLRDLDTIPEDIRTAVRNNGGGHANHSLFWEIMSPNGGGDPSGDLAEAIDDTFGSVGHLQELVNDAGLGQFGSGWAWLVVDEDGRLEVMNTPNQDSPYSVGRTPLLGIDVWEHAYYLKYQNQRGEYLDAWWNTVNWEAIAERFQAARQG
jgi:Fe-Mn family superoxide dismutase